MAEIQSIEARIQEVDALIVKVARELADQIDAGATWQAIDTTVGFLELQMRRRNNILHEYRKAGGKTRGIYSFGSHVATEDAPCI